MASTQWIDNLEIESVADDGAVDDWHFAAMAPEERETVLNWLYWNLIPSEKTTIGNSYGMKHVLQDRTRIYMTNNQFKEAMLQAGYYPKNPTALNWTFHLKRESPIFQHFRDGRTGIPYTLDSRVNNEYAVKAIMAKGLPK